MENKSLIQQFVDQSVIAKGDYELLDLLWTLYYSLPSKTGYDKHKDLFKRWLGTTCRRNLEKKHQQSRSRIKEKMNTLISFLNSIPDFLSYDNYYDDEELLHGVLKNSTYSMLVKDTEERVSKAIFSELECKIFAFVLHYIPDKISESRQKADEFKAINQFFDDTYMGLHDFRVRENKEMGEITHFMINTKEWTYLFNKIFDAELKEYKFKSKSYSSRTGIFMFSPYEQYDEHSFWQLGDELVKLGVGYWVSLLSAKGNVAIEFIIPKFIYDSIEPYREKLPKTDGITTMVAEITQEKQQSEWALSDLTEEVEMVSDFSEAEIEYSIVSNPSVLEDELEVIGRQFPTAVGYIDILCRDKQGNYVIIELKKGLGSFEVVGQIQKYMAWVHENLEGTGMTRGMIVVKNHDEQLEYAIKGSKFPIEVKIFGEEAPLVDNIKYCDHCGKPNRKSAKYCIKCGEALWL